MKRIRKYRSKTWALKFARKMNEKFPQHIFSVMTHPYDFGWSVAMLCDDRWAYCTY